VRDDRRELRELLVGVLQLGRARLGDDAGLVRLGEVDALDDDAEDLAIVVGDDGAAPADQAPAVGRVEPLEDGLVALVGLRRDERLLDLGQAGLEEGAPDELRGLATDLAR